uniref:Cystatin domain-containing protein n=1 Tax=Cyprinus carpio TaxID=7962 RepID=A0A8C1LCU5_CYPCA
MRVSYQTLVLLFLAGLCSLEKVSVHTFFSRPIPGTLQNVSKNDTGVKEAVLTGTYSFNNKSNDAFLFKASAVDDAKRQIVKGIRYILEVEISRTVCRKRGNTDDLNNCPFQTDRLLRQVCVCFSIELEKMKWLSGSKVKVKISVLICVYCIKINISHTKSNFLSVKYF